MGICSHTVPPALRPFVVAAHGYRVPANPTGIHRGLPSLHLTLVVELAAPLRVDGPGGGVAAHGVVGGLHTRPALIDASAPQDGLQYALTPRGAGALLGVPAAALRQGVVDLVDVLGPDGSELVERLHDAAGWPERFDTLDDALLRRLGAATATPPEVTEAWRLIVRSGGRARVEAVAAHVGWSRRHLAERFLGATGLTPKQAARVARFEGARRWLVTAPPPPLSEIAVRCGYADQSHLGREWRALAGCSVTTWLREELPFVPDSDTHSPAESLA